MVPEVDLRRRSGIRRRTSVAAFFRGHSGVLQDPFPGHPDGAVAVEADVRPLGIQVFCPEDKAAMRGVFGDKGETAYWSKARPGRGIHRPACKADVLLIWRRLSATSQAAVERTNMNRTEGKFRAPEPISLRRRGGDSFTGRRSCGGTAEEITWYRKLSMSLRKKAIILALHQDVSKTRGLGDGGEERRWKLERSSISWSVTPR